MWANAQRDGRPAEYRWRPLFNVTKFGWRPVLECRAVMLPRCETHWNFQGCPKLDNRCQPLVGRSSPYYEDMWRRYCCLTSFFQIVNTCLTCKDIARQSGGMVMPFVVIQATNFSKLLIISSKKWHNRQIYFSEAISLFCSTFSLACWIAQCKNDGTIVNGGHLLQDLFSESSSHCCNAYLTQVFTVIWSINSFALNDNLHNELQLQRCEIYMRPKANLICRT